MATPYEPSSEDWARAVTVIVMVDDLGSDDFRAVVKKVSRMLTREGLAAHRNADVLEGRSQVTRSFTKSVPFWEHTRAAILTKLSAKYTERHWLVVATNLAQLDEAEPNDVESLRQQAARLLDAALLLDEITRWYEVRSAEIDARDLVNDTIVSIMLAWNYLKPTKTAAQIAAQLAERKLSLSTTTITANRLKTAHSRHRERVASLQGKKEAAGPFHLPLLSSRHPE